MQCSTSAIAKNGIAALFLFCSVMLLGCESRERPKLYIYCNETFWYVMQEEALYFNKIYGFQVILIPLRAERTPHATDETVDINSDRQAPVQWRSMPRSQTQPTTDTPATPAPIVRTIIHADIEEQITRIGEENFGDLFLSDSQQHLAKLQKLALSVNEFPVCYLTVTMLVPKDNPHSFRSVKNVLEANRKLGIVDPSVDGLGESSWKILGKIVPSGESAIPMDRIRIYERQYDLLEALEQGTIDAALVWNATSLANFLLIKYADAYNAEWEDIIQEAERKKDYDNLRVILLTMYEHLIETKSFAEEVPLTENPDERCVVAVQLIALGTTTRYGYCERFSDFMRSRQGKDILRRFGFVPE